MAREEEIKQAAHESLCDDKSYISSYEEKGFIKGAEWSDENPDEEIIAKYLYEKKGYPIDLNGNLPSFDETMKATEEYLKYKQDKFIEKAVDYIANYLRCDGYTLQTKAKFIKDFKNYIKG